MWDQMSFLFNIWPLTQWQQAFYALATYHTRLCQWNLNCWNVIELYSIYNIKMCVSNFIYFLCVFNKTNIASVSYDCIYSPEGSLIRKVTIFSWLIRTLIRRRWFWCDKQFYAVGRKKSIIFICIMHWLFLRTETRRRLNSLYDEYSNILFFSKLVAETQNWNR